MEIRHHVTRHLEKFSLPMRRNGYFGASGQNLISPFDPGTSISCKTSIYPLSGDVFGIYLMFLCSIWDLVTLTFDLLTLAASRVLSFIHPTHIPVFSILRWSVAQLCITESDHISITWNGHCACAVSRDLSPGGKNYPYFWKYWSQFIYSLFQFQCATKNNIYPIVKAIQSSQSMGTITCPVHRGPQKSHVTIFDPKMSIHYTTFMGLRWRLRVVYIGASPC